MATIKQDAKCFGLSKYSVAKCRIKLWLKINFSKQGRADRRYLRGMARNFVQTIFESR